MPDKTTKPKTIQVISSPNRLQALLELIVPSSELEDAPSTEEIIELLDAAGVETTDAVHARIAQYIQFFQVERPADSDSDSDSDTEAPREIPERFLVAEGTAPTEPEDARFEWHEAYKAKVQDWLADAPIDYYNVGAIQTIDIDANIGQIIAATDAVPGRDVFGKDVPPRRNAGQVFRLGHGLRGEGEAPTEVFTEAPGRVVEDGMSLSVEELLTIPKDVDFSTGNLDACIDIHVRGMIKGGFEVKTSKSLAVDKAIESASIGVAGDLSVRGGLFYQGRERKVDVGGTLVASICDGAQIRVGLDAFVVKEIRSCELHADGHVKIEHGAIVGGTIHGCAGVTAKIIGSDVGAPTLISVGIPTEILYQARLMEQQSKHVLTQAQTIRDKVAPLMANLKRLTPAQREQATELMYKADEIDLQAEEAVKEKTALLDAARPADSPFVMVAGMLHPDVVISFGERETRIRQGLKGPIRIELQKIDDVTEIVAVNALTSSITTLPSVETDWAKFEKLAKAKKEAAAKNGG